MTAGGGRFPSGGRSTLELAAGTRACAIATDPFPPCGASGWATRTQPSRRPLQGDVGGWGFVLKWEVT